jgi:hypothetical protein
MIAGVFVEIRTEHLLSTSLKRYLYTRLYGAYRKQNTALKIANVC